MGNKPKENTPEIIEAMIHQEGNQRGTTRELPNDCPPASSSED